MQRADYIAGIVAAGFALLSWTGCKVWRDYGARIPYESETADATTTPSPGDAAGIDGADASNVDTQPDLDRADGVDRDDAGTSTCADPTSEPEPLSTGSGVATRQTTLCRGDTRWYTVTPSVGAALDVVLAYPVEETILSTALLPKRPSETNSPVAPVARPIWSETGVELSHRVTSPGPYHLRLHFPSDAPGDLERVDASLEVESQSFAERVRWIAPDGEGDGDGTAARPWRNWPTALENLKPGDLLVAKPGTWTSEADCSDRRQPCLPGSAMPDVDCAQAEFTKGTAEQPIVVAAESERRSVLVAPGDDDAFTIDDCSHWQLDGLRARNRDRQSDSGGSVIHVDDSENIRLERLLLQRPNRDRNVALVRLVDSSYIEVVESELYAFHEEAIRIDDADDVTILRNYIHSRSLDDTRPDASFSEDDDRGDAGIVIDPGDHVQVVDSIIADVATGVQIQAGGSSSRDRISVSDNNLLQGVMIRSVDEGVVFDSDASKCSSADAPACTTDDNRVLNTVVLDSNSAFRIDGGNANTIEHSTAHDASSTAFALEPGDPTSMDVFPPSQELSIVRSLAFGTGEIGFDVDSQVDEWTLDAVNSFGPTTAFDTPDSTGTRLETDPAMDDCRVYIPEDSPMREVDGARIGAHIVRRHNGASTTDRFLWHQLDGTFACGARAPGLNTSFDDSCGGAHRQFHVGTDGCAIP